MPYVEHLEPVFLAFLETSRLTARGLPRAEARWAANHLAVLETRFTSALASDDQPGLRDVTKDLLMFGRSLSATLGSCEAGPGADA